MSGAVEAVGSFIGSAFTGGGGGPIGQFLGSILGPFSGFVAPLLVGSLISNAIGGEERGGGTAPAPGAPTPPAVGAATAMPTAGPIPSEEETKAKSRAIAKQMSRRGRLSTILTSGVGGETEMLGG